MTALTYTMLAGLNYQQAYLNNIHECSIINIYSDILNEWTNLLTKDLINLVKTTQIKEQ